MEEIFYFIFLKEKTYFLVSPERLWGDLLGVMDAARRNVSVLLINHPSGPYLCTHTLEKGGGKEKVERMNYRASRCG
jgi:hypothetical protein